MGRPKRILQAHYPYHITTRTNNKTFRFNKKKIIKIYADVLNFAIKKYSVKVFHFILMANHYHIIIQTPEENLHRFFQFVNSRVALRYNKREKRSGHLWGERYRATILSTDEHYLRCIRYIYLNPVRAGEVKTPNKWADSTFQFHAFGKPVEIVLSRDHFFVIVTRQMKKEFNYGETFLNLFDDCPDNEYSLKMELRRRFYGSDWFIEDMRAQYSSA